MSNLKQSFDDLNAQQTAFMQETTTAIDNIVADINALIAQLANPSGDMTTEEEQQVLADMQARTNALREISDKAKAAAGISTAGDTPTP